MHIDSYKNYIGDYVMPNGDVCGNAEAALTSLLGFCDCGAPDSAMKYVRDALQLVDDRKKKLWEGEITYEQWREYVGAVLQSEGAEYFMWYWLNEKGFTEHGVSVPGWLTPDGEEMLSDLNEYLNE